MAIDVMKSVEIIEIMENFIANIRPAEDLRHLVDINYKIDNQSVIIYELRPFWNKPDGEKMECFIAKATFIKTQNNWQLYWKRADGKWHHYSPTTTVNTLHQFIGLVIEDKHACFWG